MKTCLIVDDSSVIRKVTRRILEKQNYMVLEAASGQEAVERCQAGMPDTIIVDWLLPEMEGAELISALRHAQGDRRPGIIYCTSENDQEDIGRAISIGADTVLMKPFDRRALSASMAAAEAASI